MSYEKEKETEKVSIEQRDNASESFDKVPQIATVGENVNAKLANPLQGIPQKELLANAARFAHDHGLGELEEAFQKGALVAQNPAGFETLPLLTDGDREVLRREVTHRWHQPWELYYLVISCSLGAMVQGVCVFFVCSTIRCTNLSLVLDGRVSHQRGQFVLCATVRHTGSGERRNQ